MKKFTKILALVTVVAMLVCCFASCGQTNSDNNATTASNADTDKVYKVGICQLVQHEALDAATKGFKEALKAKLGDKVEFDEQNASGKAENCQVIVNKFISNKVDLIMANATDALTSAATATDKIPVVATSITDFGTALNMQLNDGKTGINVTGTSDLAPLDQQAAMIKELVPTAKNVGIIYCSSEKNSKYQVEQITKYLKDLGIEAKSYPFADTKDISTVAQKAVTECDALYAPTDNTVADNSAAINNIAEPAGKPLIAGEQGICKGCGIATLSITYYDIGYKAGEMAYEILANGKDPKDMKIEYSDKFEKLYSKDRCEKLGIKIPSDYKAIEE